jgi:hypothetical protein
MWKNSDSTALQRKNQTVIDEMSRLIKTGERKPVNAVLVEWSPADVVEVPMQLALTAGLSVLVVIVAAVAVGATIPVALDRLGIDPVMTTGVFIITGNNILTALILMATLFFLRLTPEVLIKI